jgi:hypothetical protein
MDGAGTARAGMVITKTCQKSESGGTVDPKAFELPKATGDTIFEP